MKELDGIVSFFQNKKLKMSNENIQSSGVYGVLSNASFCFEFLNKGENNAKKVWFRLIYMAFVCVFEWEQAWTLRPTDS